ncbi:MAG TPA: hypothetical protein VGI10_09570 [Polyangiaceae bacterium]|jgi:hypothetical protein
MNSIKSLTLALDWASTALLAYAALAVGADTLATFAAGELSRQTTSHVQLNLLPIGCAELACAFLVIQPMTRLYTAALAAIGFGGRLLPAFEEQELVLSARALTVVAVLLILTTIARRGKWTERRLDSVQDAETAG